jgi:pantetheine-phosphate adenylyltransferase
MTMRLPVQSRESKMEDEQIRRQRTGGLRMVRALFPGTFDPIHYGHIDIASRASRLFDEVVMAVYDKPLKSLMFSPEERMDLVRQAFEGNLKIKVTGYSSLTVNYARQIDAQVIVRGLRVFSDFEFEFRMGLANQRLASDIETVAFITAEEHTFLSSSTVKEIASLAGDVSSMVPAHVEEALKKKVMTLGDGQAMPNALRD